MIKTNIDRVVMQSVMGKVHNPTVRKTVQRFTAEDKAVAFPTVGGICYNVTIGDSVYGWAGDHIEPDVSLHNSDSQENDALNFLSCIGNEATVISGDAKGKKGYVTGMHGGIQHTMVWFDEETKQQLCPDDKVLVKGWGQGLALTDFPDIRVLNIDPLLFNKLPIEQKEGKLIVEVTAIVPAHFMGSGIGSGDAATGDYDIMTADRESIKKCGLSELRFGDIVFLQDCDTTIGRGYLLGSGTVGVVVHSDCLIVGHGPGVTSILTSRKNLLVPKINKNANIGRLLGIIK